MAIDLNDEIVQDFLVEAGEILEQLNQQLVDLEAAPDDTELLNTVFRAFHTIKGGAGFLALDNMVNICHRAEDVFNLLRHGERHVDAHLMDVVLKSLDVVNDMFEQVREGEDPSPAPKELFVDLEALSQPGDIVPATQSEDANGSPFSLAENKNQEPVSGEANGAANDKETNTDITDDEFEALLDQLHGKDKFARASVSNTKTKQDSEKGSEHGSLKPADKNQTAIDKNGKDEITDEEFEDLLDQIQAKKQTPKHETQQPDVSSKTGKDEINADEFEDMLDKIHGKNKAPSGDKASAITPGSSKTTQITNQTTDAAANRDQHNQAPKPETTVRVGTRVLDRVMNMVGELVLVRNRLSTLESSMDSEDMTEAVDNLDVITSELQAAVMRTRMQPIKKVFGRFPRLVRDLARSLNKEVILEMRGEDTDLDKNLVEALADPLIHLVRNAVDHGIESPDVREANGKNKHGQVRNLIEAGIAQTGEPAT